MGPASVQISVPGARQLCFRGTLLDWSGRRTIERGGGGQYGSDPTIGELLFECLRFRSLAARFTTSLRSSHQVHHSSGVLASTPVTSLRSFMIFAFEALMLALIRSRSCPALRDSADARKTAL